MHIFKLFRIILNFFEFLSFSMINLYFVIIIYFKVDNFIYIVVRAVRIAVLLILGTLRLANTSIAFRLKLAASIFNHLSINKFASAEWKTRISDLHLTHLLKLDTTKRLLWITGVNDHPFTSSHTKTGKKVIELKFDFLRFCQIKLLKKSFIFAPKVDKILYFFFRNFATRVLRIPQDLVCFFHFFFFALFFRF